MKKGALSEISIAIALVVIVFLFVENVNAKPKGSLVRKNKNIYLETRYAIKQNASQALVDFINENYDRVFVAALSSELRDQVQGPELLLYRSLQGTWTDFNQFNWNHINANENMFCHFNGERIKTIWDSWLMARWDFVDPRKPDALKHWINYYAKTAANQINMYNYDGLFIDSATNKVTPGSLEQGKFPPEAYSDEKWREATYVALDYIKSQLPKKKVIFNGLHGGYGETRSLYLSDGGVWEAFAYIKGDTYVGLQKWKEVIDIASRSKNKTVTMVSKKLGLSSDKQARMFVLSSYLLASSPNLFLTMVDLNYLPQYKYIFYFPEYTINLGRPQGNYELRENVYLRRFKKGMAVVNPTEEEQVCMLGAKSYKKVIPHGGGPLGSDGPADGYLEYELVSGELVLPAVSGAVLLNQ